MIERISKARIPVRIMASTLIPGLTDHEMEGILEPGKDSGAKGVSWISLRLTREVSELFQDWLDRHASQSKKRILGHFKDIKGGILYSLQWFKRMWQHCAFASFRECQFQVALKRYGLEQKVEKLRVDLFRPPDPKGQPLALF